MKNLFCILFICFSIYVSGQNIDGCAFRNLNIPENKELKSYDIFLCGEIHYQKGNDRIKADLFEQLYKGDSVRIWMFELSYCMGIVINDYFENNNNLWIKQDEFYPEEVQSLKKLKAFYDSLPQNDKFKVEGVDYEKGIKMYFLPAIKILMPKKEGRVYINPQLKLESAKMLIGAIDKMDTTQYLKAIDPEPYINKIKEDILSNEKEMIDYWGENYKKVKKIIYQFDVRDSVNPGWHRRVRFYNSREEYMYKNIVELHTEYPNKKFFGQFGRAHTVLTKQESWDHWKDWESFAAKCNMSKDSPFKGRVASFYIYDPHTRSERRHHVTPIDKTFLLKLKQRTKEGEATIFDLKCIDAAYFDEVVKTKFQYLIVNRYGEFKE